MVTVAKMMDGRIVEIVKAAESVMFSSDRGWFMICFDFDRPERRRCDIKWVPASTWFVWVNEFSTC